MIYTPPTSLAHPEALTLTSLKQDGDVIVKTVFVPGWLGRYYAFVPKKKARKKGFILYPGGFLAPRVYCTCCQCK